MQSKILQQKLFSSAVRFLGWKLHISITLLEKILLKIYSTINSEKYTAIKTTRKLPEKHGLVEWSSFRLIVGTRVEGQGGTCGSEEDLTELFSFPRWKTGIGRPWPAALPHTNTLLQVMRALLSSTTAHSGKLTSSIALWILLKGIFSPKALQATLFSVSNWDHCS